MAIFKFLVLFACLSLISCRELILHDLSETEANKMLSRLLESDLDVRKEKQADGKWAISLPKEESSRAIRFLSTHKLLKEEGNIVVPKNNLMLSREEQLFRYERALSREIEATLSGISAVLLARVHLNLPSVDPILGQRVDAYKGSGSVLVVIGKEPIDTVEVASLVAGASGIPASQISVVVSYSPEQAIVKTKEQKLNLYNESQVRFSSEREAVKKIFLKLIEKINITMAKIPWKIIGLLFTASLLLVVLFRIIYRNEKVSM